MSGSMSSLYVGVTGLTASQNALNTTAHNLTNIGTKGYVRQQALFADTNYSSVGINHINSMQVGLGTNLAAVRQVRDTFLDKSYRIESGRYSYYEVQYQTADEIEDVMGELEGVEFQNSLEDFWTSIQSLANEPDNIVQRTTTVQTAVSFVERANTIYAQLKDYQLSLNTKIKNQVDEVNSIGQQIVDLNYLIQKAEAGNVENANDYRDTRNLLLDQLATYGEISYDENKYGVVTVNFEGVQFVSETGYNKMGVEKMSENSEMIKPVWEFFDTDVFDLSRTPKSDDDTDVGSLKGILIARGDAVANYSDIPVKPTEPKKSDYATDALYNAAYAQYETDLSQFEADTKVYNQKVNQSIVMSVQAQLDQLVHGVVTKINDILCPNETVTDSVTGVTYKVLASDASIGMGDGCEVPGTELFSRIGSDRYEEVTITRKKEDGSTYTETRYAYKEEDASDPNSLYSITNIQVNPDVLKNVSLIPLSNANKTGDYAVDVCKELTSAWTETFATLDPNTTTKNTFKDYYITMVGAIANRGNTTKSIADNQESLSASIDSQRQQIIGVSSDEELTKLIQYQHAYNAASRYFSVANDMLEQLINNLG
ncbi:flagellar hook-associated protein FlgK [Lachnospiraceae bacterium KM106-2]|nr:flagellar hook-associated protein FlgK [Lachnospiraceae bacterium KM106-2]